MLTKHFRSTKSRENEKMFADEVMTLSYDSRRSIYINITFDAITKQIIWVKLRKHVYRNKKYTPHSPSTEMLEFFLIYIFLNWYSSTLTPLVLCIPSCLKRKLWWQLGYTCLENDEENCVRSSLMTLINP